jgi:hypothetical protein
MNLSGKCPGVVLVVPATLSISPGRNCYLMSGARVSWEGGSVPFLRPSSQTFLHSEEGNPLSPPLVKGDFPGPL